MGEQRKMTQKDWVVRLDWLSNFEINENFI